VLEMFIFSKLWFLAQILALLQGAASRATSLAGAFLLGDHCERLAWQELHHRREAGSLAVSCVFTRGQALLAKQMCLQVAAGGTPAGYLAFWLGLAVGHYVPCLAAGFMRQGLPAALCRQGKSWLSFSLTELSLQMAWLGLGLRPSTATS
jgi:hypothetical protein